MVMPTRFETASEHRTGGTASIFIAGLKEQPLAPWCYRLRSSPWLHILDGASTADEGIVNVAQGGAG